MPPKIRGDSAFVRLRESTTMNDRLFVQGSLFTLVRRDGRWVVAKAELTDVS